jgi:hypothetical protein
MFAGWFLLAERPIQQLARDQFGLDLFFDLISMRERQAAAPLEPVVAEAAAAIIATQSANIDETSLSEANEKAGSGSG